MKENVFVIEGLEDFNLEHIFDCGQCFRWNKISKDNLESDNAENLKEKGSSLIYQGVAVGHSVVMEQEGKTLSITNCSKDDFENIWYKYLDLERDYGNIKSTLISDDNKENSMKKACEYGYGIRLLHQDLWETIVSFIISQNNNIPRIKGCIERLCALKGEEIAEGVYDFPTVEVLAKSTEEELAPIRLGYRSGYIIKSAQQVMEKGFPKTLEELLELHGVGPKVANCISLFGLREYNSFPIDVWVKRVMAELYGFEEKDLKGMKNYAEKHFGKLGGFAQQYLFYYMRSTGNK